MSKLILLLVIAAMGCKLVLGQWPWQMLALPAGKTQVAKARTLLGVSVGASRAEIIEAHKRLLVQVHPDRGGNEALVYEANAARDLLLAQAPSSLN